MATVDDAGSGENGEDSDDQAPAADSTAGQDPNGQDPDGEAGVTPGGSGGGAWYVQHVTAVNGFAYGAQHADIHVFGDGKPLYLLANGQPEPATDPAWLRRLPSRMLNARRAVVPFTGRDGDLAALVQWRDTTERLAVRWLHGPCSGRPPRYTAE